MRSPRKRRGGLCRPGEQSVQPEGQTFHGHRERRTERPCGATGEAFTGGVSRRPASPESPVSPVRPWVSHGTSQTCLRVQGQLEVWKFGGLDVWFLCSAISLSPHRGAPFSVLRSLFSVLRGAKRPSPAGAWGSAPHPPINQSAKSFVSLAVEGLALWACTVSFVISNYSGSPACGSTPLICSKSVQSAVPYSGSLCALCVPLCPLW